LLAVGLLILVGLFGYVLNQQPLLKPAPDIVAEAPRPESLVTAPPATDAPQSADTLKRSAPPMQVVYMVTHKHRLRDCHGRLTFSREGLRFDSDEPQDSFAVRREDVTIEGDALRIRDKMWRFEFDDGVRVERIFQDWKAGTLRPVSAP
jgi:hypothetical protein